MPSNPNNSFIPKQGPVRRQRQTASRTVYIFSVISYLAIASTMTASAGSFLYLRHVDKQLNDRAEELSQAIGDFNESDMNQVKAFNVRLAQARERLDNNASVYAVFEAIEDATAQSVSLSEFKIDRQSDSSLDIAAKIETDSFDSSLFQRGVFERSQIVETVEVADLTLAEAASTDGGSALAGVSFLAKITVPISKVPNLPSATDIIQTVVIEEEVATSSPDVTESEDFTTDDNEFTP